MGYQPRPPAVLPGLRLRNQRTQALIKRDVIWQIVAPLAAATLLVAVLMALLILPVGAPARSVWADISLIVLIIPTAVMGLLLLVVLVALAAGLFYLLRELPFFSKRMQDMVALLSYRLEGGAGKLANVILSVRSAWAGAQRAAEDLRSMLGIRRAG